MLGLEGVAGMAVGKPAALPSRDRAGGVAASAAFAAATVSATADAAAPLAATCTSAASRLLASSGSASFSPATCGERGQQGVAGGGQRARGRTICWLPSGLATLPAATTKTPPHPSSYLRQVVAVLRPLRQVAGKLLQRGGAEAEHLAAAAGPAAQRLQHVAQRDAQGDGGDEGVVDELAKQQRCRGSAGRREAGDVGKGDGRRSSGLGAVAGSSTHSRAPPPPPPPSALPSPASCSAHSAQQPPCSALCPQRAPCPPPPRARAPVVCSSLSGYFGKKRYSSNRLCTMHANTSCSRPSVLFLKPLSTCRGGGAGRGGKGVSSAGGSADSKILRQRQACFVSCACPASLPASSAARTSTRPSTAISPA